jgi:hypothetical protein
LSGLNAALEAFAGVYRANQASTENISERPRYYCRCSEGRLGESEREQTGGREGGQAKDVCFGSAQDRNRTTSKGRQKKAPDLD